MKVANWLTMVVTVAWLASLVARIVLPTNAATFAAADAGYLICLGYWFSANAIHRKNGNA